MTHCKQRVARKAPRRLICITHLHKSIAHAVVIAYLNWFGKETPIINSLDGSSITENEKRNLWRHKRENSEFRIGAALLTLLPLFSPLGQNGNYCLGWTGVGGPGGGRRWLLFISQGWFKQLGGKRGRWVTFIRQGGLIGASDESPLLVLSSCCSRR